MRTKAEEWYPKTECQNATKEEAENESREKNSD